MLTTFLATNPVDFQDIRTAIVLYAIAKVLQQSAALIKTITEFVRVVKGGKTSNK